MRSWDKEWDLILSSDTEENLISDREDISILPDDYLVFSNSDLSIDTIEPRESESHSSRKSRYFHPDIEDRIRSRVGEERLTVRITRASELTVEISEVTRFPTEWFKDSVSTVSRSASASTSSSGTTSEGISTTTTTWART